MDQDNASVAYLVIQHGSLSGKRVELWKECTTIGRSRNCDIFLEDLTVHRKQASILRTPNGSYILRDDNGSGDSLVNGNSVREQMLQHGDRLSFGNTDMTFYTNEGTRPFKLPISRGRESRANKQALQVAARLQLSNGRASGALNSVEVLPEMTIGRSRECHIFLEDLAVSRHHATLHELPGGEYELIDNQSATGTFVNGRPIDRHVLRDGDVVQIGGSNFVFRLFQA
ncbi:type III secretion system (T3SS) inner membrane Yop/YscD-like protein [Thermosporothrix hazakensis]|jgi:pSer/pThr/pTyr-binding forkhead associated (FHA) protein|uniref:Type III secretion system (T3SS) inner membrane Yop/YscD-like protein n=2 Tax=Thermosporothrix TaxID=768650 RepID=A0A326UB73_THEHA|nr:FHA domain-containing protein [Thermosporothrix hazakensis]PZW32928.1 type III secretion system (T3SS) inner membrane Yop/YscD-like protein [Thermosporothrix hazakensis]BBH90910.1 hypothetical protein KTC_56610 [Thermosporothrix sp. COM3]GCE48960.1 hypothetical protein KTH_38290 [Thermosporothrix hazakensis]